jgi:hypothetical protein
MKLSALALSKGFPGLLMLMVMSRSANKGGKSRGGSSDLPRLRMGTVHSAITKPVRRLEVFTGAGPLHEHLLVKLRQRMPASSPAQTS